MALCDVSLEVETGELFGIIGPDGAGKTTLFRIMTTLSLADEGSASVAGYDVVSDFKTIRNRIGYMPGRFSLYQDLTVEENLELFAAVFNTSIKENYYLVKDIYKQLEPFKTRRAGKLSGGMKQKLALCCALIHQPDVLFLDEPTTGVDPVSRKEFWHMLKKLKEQGITIIVSTPYMDEASLCDRIALINNGRFLKTETPTEIIKGYGKSLFAIDAPDKIEAMNVLSVSPEILNCYLFGETIHAVANADTQPEAVQKRLSDLSHVQVRSIEPTIEDCFLDLN